MSKSIRIWLEGDNIKFETSGGKWTISEIIETLATLNLELIRAEDTIITDIEKTEK